MEKDVARHVAHLTLAGTAHLDSAADALEEHGTAGERALYRQAVAAVKACIEREILERLYAAHPDLRDEIAARVANTARASRNR
mgnify:CR=1 FL=1